MLARPFDGSSAPEKRQLADVVQSPVRGTPDRDEYGGLQESAVQDLYDATMRIVERQLVSLRRLQIDADGRLRSTKIEQQQLDRFLDELSYQTRFAAEAQGTANGAASSRLRELTAQVAQLRGRQEDLRRLEGRLDRLSGRLSWLVRQIELSASKINETEGDESDTDPWALVMREQLIQGQEAERSRLAREIHDGPAQALTNTLMRLRLVESMMATQPENAARELAYLRVAVQDSLADVRRSIFNLRPASLREVGLIGTLERFITEYRKHSGIEVVAELPERFDMGPEQELALFRIVQEALHNIMKHAGATRVDVTLARRPEHWELVIIDNGHGFNVSQQKQQQVVGSGLASMRERAVIAGGSLEVASKPGYGTRLLMTLPLPDAKREKRD